MIEMLVTISIAAILLGVALPSYTNITATYRAKGAASDIYFSLIRARSEAARLNESITITPSASGWNAGWTVTGTDSSSNTITLLVQGASSGVSITGGPANIVYMSSGRIKGSTSPSFTVSSSNGKGEKRCVSIDLSGRPNVTSAAC